MSRLCLYVILFAAIILPAHSLYAAYDQPVVIDFEDVDPNLTFNSGSFDSSVAKITICPQVEFPNNNDPNKYVYFSRDALAGGSGIELGEIRNLNLDFDFKSSVDNIEFKYYDGGGNLNLKINGQMLNFYNFGQIDGFDLGGTDISVQLNNNDQGTVRISGMVYSFQLGGTRLWIDDMNVSGLASATFHVDVQGSDDNFGLSTNAPFATIQKAIDCAHDGDVVLVHPGKYFQSVNFSGKAITVTAADEPPVIQVPGGIAVIFPQGEGKSSVFKNFIITRSSQGISCQAGSPLIKNVTVTENDFGVTVIEGSAPIITNSIIWGNKNGDIYGSGVQYSCSGSLAQGVGNIAVDPMFVRTGFWDDRSTPNDPNDDIYIDGDYHIKSAGWRWSDDPIHGSNWYYDSVTSRCIDAGNPSDLLAGEPVSLGIDPQNLWAVNKRVNMGAYGSTQWASMAPDGHSLNQDINNDGIINGNDLVCMGYNWLLDDPRRIADITRDGSVDLNDFMQISASWLNVTSWGNALSLKDYWPFEDHAQWSSVDGEPNTFSYRISDSFDCDDIRIWHFTNNFYLSGQTHVQDEYSFYYDGDLYSTNDANDLEYITTQPQLFKKIFPGTIVPDVPVEINGYGFLYPVRGSLSKVLENSEYTLADFPMGENNDVIAFIADYGLETERIVIILARGFGPLLIGSDFTEELIIDEPYD